MVAISCSKDVNQLVITSTTGIITLKTQQIIVQQDNFTCVFNVSSHDMHLISMSLHLTEAAYNETCSNKEHQISKTVNSNKLVLQKMDNNYSISYKNEKIVFCDNNKFSFLGWTIIQPRYNHFFIQHSSLKDYKIYYTLSCRTPNFTAHNLYGISHRDKTNNLGKYEISIRHILHPTITIKDYLLLSFSKYGHRNLYQITTQNLEVMYNFLDENLRLNYKHNDNNLELEKIQISIRDNTFFDLSHTFTVQELISNVPVVSVVSTTNIPCNLEKWYNMITNCNLSGIFSQHEKITKDIYTALKTQHVHIHKSFSTPKLGYLHF